MALDALKDGDLIGLAWIGSSIGALDLGLAATGVVSTMPSVELLGSGIGDLLIWGYLLAGAVALASDLGVIE